MNLPILVLKIEPVRKKRRFELWLPFSASAIGIAENDLLAVHNLPVKQAMARLTASSNWRCSTVYFTEKRQSYRVSAHKVPHEFFPISLRLRKQSHTFGRQLSLHAFWHFLRDPPDVVGFHGGYGRFTHTMARVCRFRGIPYFVYVGGWAMPQDINQIKCLEGAVSVVTFTERQRAWLKQEKIYTGSNTRSWTIGVDATRFTPAIGSEEMGQSPRLLYVGRMVDNKGVLEAIQAVRVIRDKIPGIKLDVLGSHHDRKFLEHVFNYIKDNQLTDTVILHGAVPYKDLPLWYQKASLLVFPSPLESFGFVVIESMACGTPVVALKGSGGPEDIISNGIDGILTELPNLSSDVITILQNPELLMKMSKAAVEKVHQSYSLDRTTHELQDMLDLTSSE